MHLAEYNPKSQAIVSENLVSRAKFPVLDVHTHWGQMLLGADYAKRYETKEALAQVQALGVQRLVNLDGGHAEDLEPMLEKTSAHAKAIYTFVWVQTERLDEPSFAKNVETYLKHAKRKGAKGVKMWKDISLTQRDASGQLIQTDDPRLDIIYETVAALGMPVLMHIADPVAFFEPINAENERYEELMKHPDWSFYGPEYPNFQALMAMQDRTIARHPKTQFIIAHFGSYAENLPHVAERLERYPNMFIDIAGRVPELGRVPYSARKFFVDYKERILFGTDSHPLSTERYPIYFRFLETYDEYFTYSNPKLAPTKGRWRIYGLGLPDDVLKAVYSENAKRLLALN